MPGAFLANSLPGGRGTARGFPSPKEPRQGLGGGACSWSSRGRSGRTEVLIKGAVLLPLPPLPRLEGGSASPGGRGFAYELHADWAVNHAEIWHAWHCPPCLLGTGPLPKSATGAMLPCVPLPLLGGAAAPPHLQQLPAGQRGVGASSSCCFSPGCCRQEGPHKRPGG